MSVAKQVFESVAKRGVYSMLAVLLWSNAMGETSEIQKQVDIRFASPLLVQYGDVPITHLDLDTHLESLDEASRSQLVNSAELLGGALSNIFLGQVFLQRALDSGLLDDPALHSRIYSSLAREIRSLYRQRFMRSMELEDYTPRARELYLTRPERFRGNQTVDFYHIAIPATGLEDEVPRLRIALESYEMLNEGADFAAVAEHLAGTHSINVGDTVFEKVNTSELLTQLAALLGQIEPGVVSPPIRSRFGWHIVKLNGINEGQVPAWEEARESAIALARQEHLTFAWERLLREVQETEFQFTEGAVAEVRRRYGASNEEPLPIEDVSQYMRSELIE